MSNCIFLGAEAAEHPGLTDHRQELGFQSLELYNIGHRFVLKLGIP